MDIKEMLFDLCSCTGVSGYEEPAAEVAKKYLEKFGEILFGLFQHTNYTGLTQSQGRELIATIQNFVTPQS